MRRIILLLCLLLAPSLALGQATDFRVYQTEDVAHVSGERGVMLLGVRKDSATSLCSADGKYCMPIFDQNGKLWVNAASDSELPAAAALADNTANPTVPGVGAFGLFWDGATWDRVVGTSTDGLLVNLGTNNDVDTELPAAAGMTDEMANPTVPSIASFGLYWNGVTWDRVVGDATDGLLVQLGSNNEVVLGAGSNNVGNVDIEVMGTAATVGAGSTTVTSDETLVAAVANTRLITLTLVEDAGGAAVGFIRHGVEGGGNCTGNIIAAYNFAANGVSHFNYGDRGVAVASGVCVDRTSGSITAAWASLVEAAP